MSPLLLWIACSNQPGDGIVRAAVGTDLFEISAHVPQRVFEVEVAAETEGLGTISFWTGGEATLVDGSSGTLDALIERDDGGWIHVGASASGVDDLGESIVLDAPLDNNERNHSCDDDCEARYRFTLTATHGDGTFVAAVWFEAQITGVEEDDDASVEVTFTEID